MNSKSRLSVAVLLALLAVLAYRSDDPIVDPKPSDEAPIQAEGLHVMVVEETDDRFKLSREQQAILQSNTWRAFVISKGGEFRQYDQTHRPVNDREKWIKAFDRDRESVPWVVISNGKTGTEQPLPPNEEEFIALIVEFL